MLSILASRSNCARHIPRTCFAILSVESSSSADTKPVIINQNLSFRPAFDSHLDEATRPLVLLYGWLVAKSKHIHKYGDFYLGKGFDVLHIKVTPTQLLWPRNAQAVCQQVLDFANKREQQPILVHGFSVGSYLYGETLVKLHNDKKYTAVGERIQGEVLDSPVDYEGIPRGVSNAVTPIPAVRKMLKHSLETYLKLLYKPVTRHYVLSSETHHANKLRVPGLFLYSNGDPIGVPEVIEPLMKRWEDMGINVHGFRFKDSGHVSHFQKYPVEYISTLNSFLQEIGMQEQEKPPEKIYVD